MLGLPLAFAAPLVLTALAALPVLYYLLRVTPPPPKRVSLPTIPLVRDLVTPERQPSRTPWWLLALRLTLAACAILAVAGPMWNPPPVESGTGRGPLILLIDTSWAAAPDWQKRRDRAMAILDAAADRPVILRASADEQQEAPATSARTAMERLRGLQPAPHSIDRSRVFAGIRDLATSQPQADIVWISDRSAIGTPDEATRTFIAVLGPRLKIIADEASPVRAILSSANERDALVIRLARPASAKGAAAGLVRAIDGRGRPLGEAAFDFGQSATTEARLAVPLEVRNDIARLEIVDGHSAASVLLLDAGSQRRKVALVSGETTDTVQPLVSGSYFVTKALAPYSNLHEAPRGPDPLTRTLEDKPEIVVLVDVATVSGTAFEQLSRFVEEGGVLIRFAGSGLAASSDALLPVKLRRGGRVLGGALSWEKPQRLAAFPEGSPFAGLNVPPDVQIERQVLAEPEPTLNERTWATLSDGTPLVTAARRGKGLVVLFHVTADTSWSSLPLSGAFVDMLRRLLPLAVAGGDKGEGGKELANPRRVLDGFGAYAVPPATARAIPRNWALPATAEHPPGFYGPPEATLAVNTLAPDADLKELDFTGATPQPLDIRPPVDLRPPLMVAAFILFLLDALAVAALAGLFTRTKLARSAAALAFAVLATMTPAPDAAAQTASDKPGPTRQDIEASLSARLAYIRTGNRDVDETSRLGLEQLTRALAQRTAFEPGLPVGLDPAKDEMVFYSLIYWPMTPDQPMPSDAALRRIDQFMKNGGSVIFDTRDATAIRGTAGATAETRRLRQMLANLDVPEIEPVPRDHVLTKTFYLLDKIVGRYAGGETWIESLPRTAGDEKRPARAGDRVSPVIITSNDLAAAWAVDRSGNPRFPMVPGEPRQREMALRAGINLAMYAMTGNYKADQVHIPALLDRLGQ